MWILNMLYIYTYINGPLRFDLCFNTCGKFTNMYIIQYIEKD